MTLRSVLIVLAAAVLAGCASPAKMENMVVAASPEAAVENPELLESMCVTQVTGGKKRLIFEHFMAICLGTQAKN